MMATPLTALFLYLLFPVVSRSQADFERMLVKESPESGASLLAPSAPDAGLLSAGDAEDSGLPAVSSARVYADSLSRLSLLCMDEEQLVVSPLPGGKHEAVSVNGDEIVRREYDGRFRLVEETVWKNSSSAADSVMLRRTRLSYEDAESAQGSGADDLVYDEVSGDFVPQRRRVPRKSAETVLYAPDGSGTVRTAVSYDEWGNAVSEERSSDGIVTYAAVRTFDTQNRLSAEEVRVSDGVRSSVRRYEYEHTQVSSVPDLRYFEDGELRVTEVHESETRFVRTVRFDGDWSAVAVYEGNRKVEEKFERD